ncbi:MAG: ABC transporter ATP-binding protein [Dictyoglomus thermophilum]|uniref:ABC transporter ATP-binding protein n=1 Tax=Dictyoglomus thermophilum TaxID=14 RepID=UPI0011EB1D81|nr:ABC transporter ATP-binding protein [Dictyoglomus thermophilum]MCX7720666.1 ABC transporter ATP-binding protein [Dictyoglomus thermophilum]TYT24192.1 ABC transporter ATP-binding protein [Dictyoglomus thermophilum]
MNTYKFIVEVEDLRKYYGNIKAVDGVSFKIKQGSIFTLLGPNGAGKTTTLEIIEGLRTSDSGKITIFGRQVERIGREEKEFIGVSLQETNLIGNLTVRETLSMFRSFYKKGLNVDDVLDFVSLKDKAKSYVEKLSGGQRQRLTIGLAIINDPLLLFLDEPTTGLDPQARRSIWDLLLQLKKQGKTIVLTTHYMEEAEFLSDWVCIMDHGKIIREGTPEDLIKSIGGESVIEVEVEHSDGFFEELSNIGLNYSYNEKHKRLIIKTNNVLETIGILLRIAEEKGINIRNEIIRQPNLEDVFLTLTGKQLREE